MWEKRRLKTCDDITDVWFTQSQHWHQGNDSSNADRIEFNSLNITKVIKILFIRQKICLSSSIFMLRLFTSYLCFVCVSLCILFCLFVKLSHTRGRCLQQSYPQCKAASISLRGMGWRWRTDGDTMSLILGHVNGIRWGGKTKRREPDEKNKGFTLHWLPVTTN